MRTALQRECTACRLKGNKTMSNMTKVIIGIVLPFLGTTLGSATVFFLKKEMNSKNENYWLLEAPVSKAIWHMAIPMMLGMSVNMIYNLTDTFL